MDSWHPEEKAGYIGAKRERGIAGALYIALIPNMGGFKPYTTSDREVQALDLDDWDAIDEAVRRYFSEKIHQVTP